MLSMMNALALTTQITVVTKTAKTAIVLIHAQKKTADGVVEEVLVGVRLLDTPAATACAKTLGAIAIRRTPLDFKGSTPFRKLRQNDYFSISP